MIVGRKIVDRRERIQAPSLDEQQQAAERRQQEAAAGRQEGAQQGQEGNGGEAAGAAASEEEAVPFGSVFGSSAAQPGSGTRVHKPKVATWGVFPRPQNISEAYGGGPAGALHSGVARPRASWGGAHRAVAQRTVLNLHCAPWGSCAAAPSTCGAPPLLRPARPVTLAVSELAGGPGPAGGRNLKPGQALETEEQAAAREARVNAALAKYRKARRGQKGGWRAGFWCQGKAHESLPPRCIPRQHRPLLLAALCLLTPQPPAGAAATRGWRPALQAEWALYPASRARAAQGQPKRNALLR